MPGQDINFVSWGIPPPPTDTIQLSKNYGFLHKSSRSSERRRAAQVRRRKKPRDYTKRSNTCATISVLGLSILTTNQPTTDRPPSDGQRTSPLTAAASAFIAHACHAMSRNATLSRKYNNNIYFTTTARHIECPRIAT